MQCELKGKTITVLTTIYIRLPNLEINIHVLCVHVISVQSQYMHLMVK